MRIEELYYLYGAINLRYFAGGLHQAILRTFRPESPEILAAIEPEAEPPVIWLSGELLESATSEDGRLLAAGVLMREMRSLERNGGGFCECGEGRALYLKRAVKRYEGGTREDAQEVKKTMLQFIREYRDAISGAGL